MSLFPLRPRRYRWCEADPRNWTPWLQIRTSESINTRLKNPPEFGIAEHQLTLGAYTVDLVFADMFPLF